MIEYLIPIFLILFWLLFIGVTILGTIFWIFMLVDCAKRNFKKENDKIVWIVLMALTSWLGALIYYFVIKRPNKR